MKRRNYLTQVCTGMSILLGGCLGDNKSTSPPENTSIRSQPCPPYSHDQSTAVCSHTAKSDRASVYLESIPPSVAIEEGDLTEEIILRLHNGFSRKLRFNPYSWGILQHTEKGWVGFDRNKIGDGVINLPPSETKNWIFNNMIGQLDGLNQLKPGLYAVEIEVPNPNKGAGWILCIALIQLKSPS